MGLADTMYVIKGTSQDYYENRKELKGTDNQYTVEAKNAQIPLSYSGLEVVVNQIALWDSTESPLTANGNQPTLQQVYDELGITLDQVSLVLGFRIELTLEDGTVVYKDYEVEMPPASIDLAGSEFFFDFMVDDVNAMEPFVEGS